jgi:hypothetical protein
MADRRRRISIAQPDLEEEDEDSVFFPDEEDEASVFEPDDFGEVDEFEEVIDFVFPQHLPVVHPPPQFGMIAPGIPNPNFDWNLVAQQIIFAPPVVAPDPLATLTSDVLGEEDFDFSPEVVDE